MLPKIGPVRFRKLVEMCGSATQVLSASSLDLSRVDGIGPKTAELISNWREHVDMEAEMAATEERGIRILTQEDEEYPAVLKEMYDAPLALYVWGELSSVDDSGVAMVGSRKHTYYGQKTARQLAFQLASSGVTVVSGLARGIDTFSHEGAIASGGRTIAVIGSGLGQIYPPENLALAEKIADGHGAVVSEFPLMTKPDKRTFPQRNRIVAGWVSGVLVVECPKWSGSLITANLAADMGKTIYAVPGQIDAPLSAGCNKLIRTGATLVTCAEDILEDKETLPHFEIPGERVEALVNPALLNLNDVEKQIYEFLGAEPILMDQILEKLSSHGLGFPQVSVTLLQLEIKKLIVQLPGQRYARRE